MKKNSIFKNITVLLFSQAVIKIIGIVYKLYLTNKTGYADTGNAIFSAAFQVYAIFLTICSIGVPNAISTLISSKFAVGDNNGAYRILKIAIAIFGSIGFAGSFILYYFANIIASKYLGMPETELVLKVLAPSIFIVSISAVLKGYFNGKEKMDITAKALSIEQIAKTILTVIFVEILSYISNKNTIIMVCGVALVTSLGSIINCFYMYIKYMKNRREIWTDMLTSKTYRKERKITIIKNIFKVTLPISICALIGSFNKTIDAFTIVKIAKEYLGEAEAVRQYGILSGKIESLVTLPFSFNMAITTTLIPTIAGYKARGETEKNKYIIKFAILIGIIISIPFFIIMYTLPEQILQILFPNASDGSLMLKISSFSIIIAVIIQTINSYFQGINKMRVQIITIAISSVVKLALNIILISNPKIGIYGAVVSNIISYLLTFGILIIYMVKHEKIHFEITKFIIKPAIICFIVYIIMKEMYKVTLVNTKLLKTGVSVAIGMTVYVISVLFTKLITKKEIKLVMKKR
ncbi:MAG: polysaccharide biosynthesis C-terminal domain-containing protein [Clostridia bacterium]|nr:polysaccharide biosynthesis C-terminal domain-containing protein [Clostridia bacterium]